ncbi:protein-L-isoaspartate O-methyltransferase [Oleiphilus messinensis]|uniref:Protein-L-isoaspartate O-methyltransferase n=1 Tax=Oleiphilus messinensis TaxID=141451 RepID=A0A1Y0ID14_9GAMM|nr:protein-L-isoaspartate(D-aspartate) O-methyltransferase [Oleiphilus messinensis]ARU57666.1 protein-L-isoaspartate O-methyltransferase [Oleiphilus messinensis]
MNLQGIGMTSQRTRLRLINRLKESGIRTQDVLEAMANTPRHIFLDEALAHRAYEDTALPIGYNQTLSQPYIVAKMTELTLENDPQRILEIGTGSGYQTSILAQLAKEVYSVERIKPLQEKARQRFVAMGLRNIRLRHADGGMGWPEAAPFHAIIVTAAPEDVPRELLSQLADGGRLVIPVGGQSQQLMVMTRTGNEFSKRIVEAVRFVPLVEGTVL